MLQQGWSGCKTGVTPTAGPCLSAVKVQGKKYYIVILLKSKSMEARWEEVPLLTDWVIEKAKSTV